MYDTHEPEASVRIKLASVYAPDRKAMYHLFKNPSNNIGEKKAPWVASDIIKSSEKVEVKFNYVYSSSTAENIDLTHTLPERENEPDSLPETFIRKEAEPKKFVQISLAQTDKIIDPVSNKAAEKAMESPKIQPKVSLDKRSEEAQVVNEPIADINLKYDFSAWLKVLPEISVEKKLEAKPANQVEPSDIITEFLKKAPSISRPKAAFFSPLKAAKMGIQEDDALVSETLAKIYLTQGNLPRALKAYQTLLLQFPEKKNIFAPRIEEIKTLMRENSKPGTK
jgi:hypothetical protein